MLFAVIVPKRAPNETLPDRHMISDGAPKEPIKTQGSLIEQEDEAGGECDGREEGISASIISGMDTSPVLEPAEHVLDTVVLAIAGAIMRDDDLVVDL